MNKISLFRVLGFPDSFGAVLLVLALILLLSPYFSGSDFGIFKIPAISESGKKSMKVLGPIVFLLCALSFVPVFSTTPSTSTNINEGKAATPSPVFTPAATPTLVTTSTITPTTTPNSFNAAGAQNLGAKWFAAMKGNDVTSLIEMADFPFFFDQEILAGPDDMRRHLQKLSSRPRSSTEELQLKSIKAKTIAEWKREGFDANRDRLLKSITYNDNDYLVILTIGQIGREEGVVLYMRGVGSEIKLAGWWD